MIAAYTIATISLVASIVGLIYSIWLNFIRRWVMKNRRNKVLRKLDAKERYVERKMNAND